MTTGPDTRRPTRVKRPGLLTTGIAGAVVAAVCCFTPLLVIGLGAVGLSAWLEWLDWLLIPALVGFVGLTAFAVVKRRRA